MLNHPALTWGDALRQGEPDRARLGGKAMGLARLVRHGFQVPDFFVLHADVPEEALDEALDAAVELFGAAGWERAAVRSSAVAEDSAEHSFAGMFETVLGVTDAEGLRAAIRRCRASGDSERVRAYREANGLPPTPVAVVVQEMVAGDASGVLFSTDPDDPDHALISAAWGLGEGVVQGSVPADTWRVPRREGGEPVVTVAHKDVAVRLVDGRPAEVAVPEGDRDRPCLPDPVIRRLVADGLRLEQLLGVPADVEFTVLRGQPFYLQVRPVARPAPRGRRLLWDNSNIIESYHGLVRPLTYTFARDAYAIVYQLFCEVMGVPREAIRANASIFPRMIGLVRGRIYYNLNAWYRLVSLLPGYRWNRHFLEQMMGVSEVAADADAAFDDGGGRLGDLLRLVRLAGVMAWRVATLHRLVADFHRRFDRALAAHRRRDLAAESPFEILDGYHELERELLWAWSTPIVNDFFVMIGFGLLRSLSGRWLPGHPDIHNALLAGEGGLDSTAPTRDALALAGRVRRNPEALALFTGEADDAAVLAGLGRWPELRRAFDDWIDRWGDRCADELKLEVPTFRQRPAELVGLLRGYLAGEPLDPATWGEEERRLRAEAEATVARELSGWRARVFRAVLRFARARVKARENLRFLRTRIFGRVREIFAALGGHLVRAGALDAAEDVTWLTVEEALGWVRGTTPTVDLRGLVALRRAEYARWEREPAPADRFHTWGPVWAHNRFTGRPAAAAEGDIVGLGACPGVVEAPARVVTDPRGEEPLDGEILVAYRTDPGWVPLFPGAAAIVVERGSLLSHSAVVAREFGIPTVVGARGVMARVRTGDRLRVDGGAGTVRLLEEA